MKKETWVEDYHYFSIYDMCGDIANPYLCINKEVADICKKYPSASQFRIDFVHNRYEKTTQGVIYFLRLRPVRKSKKKSKRLT